MFKKNKESGTFAERTDDKNPFEIFPRVQPVPAPDSENKQICEDERKQPAENRFGRTLAAVAGLVVVILLALAAGAILRPVLEEPAAGVPESLVLPKGMETVTDVMLDLSGGEYVIKGGDAFSITSSRQPYTVRNSVEGNYWTCALEQGSVTITLPAGMQEVTLSLEEANVTLEDVQADTLELSAEKGNLTANGITARELLVRSIQASVEAQAVSIEESVAIGLRNGAVYLAMPAPQEYGCHVVCNQGVVQVGETQYLTQETNENADAPFHYAVDCTSGRVEIDLMTDDADQAIPNEDSAANPENKADSKAA